MTDQDGQVLGVFESGADGGGHLRTADVHYDVRPDDVVVPARFAQRHSLRGGEAISGRVSSRGRGGKRSARTLEQIDTVDGLSLEDRLERPVFEQLTAIEPRKRMTFETPDGPLSMRILDLMTPIGFGQRGLIAAPARTGKTTLLQQMAHGASTNFPDLHIMVLLVDERPEEVTDMRRKIEGEVIASSNDRDVASHVRVARLVVARARRLVECGHDVLLLLDSLTRLGRNFNAHIRGSGRIMSGGLDIRALAEPKKIFGAARNTEEGGSLTTIASALIDTGSRMDEVIFNEFKGTGNMEMMLTRELANMRIWPAIDLNESGTRKEELLLTPEALQVAHRIRRNQIDRSPVRSMEAILAALGKYPTNAAFIKASAEPQLRRR